MRISVRAANRQALRELELTLDARLDLLASMGVDLAAVPASKLISPSESKPAPIPASGPLAGIVPRPVPNPIGTGPMKNLADPNDPSAVVIPPEPSHVLLPQSPPTPVGIPSFEMLNDVRKVAMLVSMWVDLQRAEQMLEPNVEGCRESFLYPINSRATALRAVQCYDPSIIKALRLTYKQANALQSDIVAAVKAQGVSVPPSWLLPLEMYRDTENGDSEW